MSPILGFALGSETLSLSVLYLPDLSACAQLSPRTRVKVELAAQVSSPDLSSLWCLRGFLGKSFWVCSVFDSPGHGLLNVILFLLIIDWWLSCIVLFGVQGLHSLFFSVMTLGMSLLPLIWATGPQSFSLLGCHLRCPNSPSLPKVAPYCRLPQTDSMSHFQTLLHELYLVGYLHLPYRVEVANLKKRGCWRQRKEKAVLVLSSPPTSSYGGSLPSGDWAFLTIGKKNDLFTEL